MSMLDSWLTPALQARQANLHYRQRRTLNGRSRTHVIQSSRSLLEFSSNDYLGLANEPRVIDAFCKGAREDGVGSGASAVVSGHLAIHRQLEETLADWTGRSRALLFPSGFQANLAVHDALLSSRDRVFGDRLNHASLLDGARLAGARMTRYCHGDVDALVQQLTRYSGDGRKLVASDGIFSMDGDRAPVQALATACRAHEAVLLIDDAHGIGILGLHGAGLLEDAQLDQDAVPVLVGTLSKALGAEGAFVAGSDALIETLIQFARPYIYTTSLPPAIAHAGLTALHIAREEPERRQRLTDNIAYFQQLAKQAALPITNSDTPIQPMIVGHEHTVMTLAHLLETDGFLVGAIRPPTVPKGSSRLRITLSATHQRADIEALITSLHRHYTVLTSEGTLGGWDV